MRVELDFGAVLAQWPLLATGVVWTIGLTAISAIIGVAVGIVFAWVRSHGALWLKWVVGTYVELIRNTPFIVQLFFIFFGLPSLGLRLDPAVAAILAMTINLSAYGTEIVAAGLDAVPNGQREAGRALGLRPALVFVKIVLPQALKVIFPALQSQVIIMMLESAAVSQISVRELTYEADMLQARSFRAFETYFVVTMVYLALSIGLRRILGLSGRKFLIGGPS